ncbi:MAG: NUDIX domain-containing protein [Candidatus Diapherotrites archaeon]|nr:NUDIX domain-containing protein [Candidatus Diapherotrites archaeon]
MANGKSLFTVVDKNDISIGAKEKDEITPKDLYRVAALWVTNSKGEVLLAKRAMSKKNNPGKWGPSVAGTVEAGETYESNIVKEMFEEIGLKGIKIEKGGKILRFNKENQYNYFCQWFKAEVNKGIGEFVVDASEVAEIKWIGKKELAKLIAKNSENFLDSVKEWSQSKIKF